MSAEPAGAAALAGWHAAVEGGLADRAETVVLLITGRAKAAGAPADPSRVAVVDGIDDVERVLSSAHL